MGFWNGASTLKQCFVLPKNGSKYYLKYTFWAFAVLVILCLGTPLFSTLWRDRTSLLRAPRTTVVGRVFQLRADESLAMA